jgi:hypothetical protein
MELDIHGTLFSANVGCFHKKGKEFTYSLFDPALAAMIGKKIQTEKFDICLLQEAWTFTDILFHSGTEEYEVLGLNDMIAVRKAFGHFEPGSYRSYSKRFINPRTREIKILDEEHGITYNGSTDPEEFGVSIDFDVSSVIVVEKKTSKKILVVNVHVTSAPWNDEIRAAEIRNWIINDAIKRANELCEGRILIAGDFNEDEIRKHKTESAKAIKELLSVQGINDASQGSLESTVNYPLLKRKLDHMMGTAIFSNFRVGQPLLEEDVRKFKKEHKLAWMYIDHKCLTSDFSFS